jgi:chaperonin cofactor prefoldin
MTDIRNQPFTTDALTIRQLKEILSVLPDTNEYGEDCEVWMSVGNNLSNVVKSVWSLNLRNEGCDIILECDNYE